MVNKRLKIGGAIVVQSRNEHARVSTLVTIRRSKDGAGITSRVEKAQSSR
jgi:hypothetical protein